MLDLSVKVMRPVFDMIRNLYDPSSFFVPQDSRKLYEEFVRSNETVLYILRVLERSPLSHVFLLVTSGRNYVKLESAGTSFSLYF